MTSLFFIIVIKPGLAWQVEPGPGKPGGWTVPGKAKDWQMQKHSKTCLTRRVNQ